MCNVNWKLVFTDLKTMASIITLNLRSIWMVLLILKVDLFKFQFPDQGTIFFTPVLMAANPSLPSNCSDTQFAYVSFSRCRHRCHYVITCRTGICPPEMTLVSFVESTQSFGGCIYEATVPSGIAIICLVITIISETLLQFSYLLFGCLWKASANEELITIMGRSLFAVPYWIIRPGRLLHYAVFLRNHKKEQWQLAPFLTWFSFFLVETPYAYASLTIALNFPNTSFESILSAIVSMLQIIFTIITTLIPTLAKLWVATCLNDIRQARPSWSKTEVDLDAEIEGRINDRL